MAIISEQGTKLLAQWEGNELRVYKDAVGKYTIGVGHLLTRQEIASGVIQIKGEAVPYNEGITEQQSLDLLAQDLAGYNDAVNQVKLELAQNQFDALVAFSFNVGVHAFLTSTLFRLLNTGDYDSVPEQLMKWVHGGGGRVIPGLVNRRAHEIKLWKGEYA